MGNAGKEVAAATKKLKKDNPSMNAIILDLRGNPGGRLDQAVEVSNVFIPKGQLITEMRGRTPESKGRFPTLYPAVDTDIPLAVLVNNRSASASEIVAGSIQDLDRGIIVGQRSFGKGLVQNVRPLSYNTQMKVTIARYFTPSGRCIQAIDYSQRNRNADGSAGKIADSLINEFKTRNGRLVYDGGGVDPDVAVNPPAMPPVIRALNEQGIIFDYTTQFASQHDSIASPRDFNITDAMYADFSAFVQERGFDFSTQTDKQLEILEKVMEKAGHAPEMEAKLNKLKQELQTEKGRDLTRHKAAISEQLRTEIINRYYYKQGVLEAAFSHDPVILKAVELLNSSEKYKQILKVE